MKIQFKLATKEDFDLLMKFFEHYQNLEIQKNRVECYTSHNKTLLMFIDNNYGGRIQWYVKEDPNFGVVELEEFYVKKEYRRQGFGKKLFQMALTKIQEIVNPLYSIFLFTNSNNNVMQHICLESGFNKAAEIINLFKQGETELLFLKTYD
ncbi:MAG: GNAT family N-acetyltransferase [Candidatus Hodarchaeota archaeon]